MKKQAITGLTFIFQRSREMQIAINRLISTTESILYIHGPAGAGKTTLVEEIINQLISKGWKSEDIIRFDCSGHPLQKQRSMLVQMARSLNTIPKLVVLDGLHNPTALISTLEKTLAHLSPKTKVILAARIPPPAVWWVSPLLGSQTAVLPVVDLPPEQAQRYLEIAGIKDKEQIKKALELSGCRPVVLADITNNPDYYRHKDTLRPELARQITDRFLSETNAAAMRDYLETAAVARRFNRDLLDHVNGTITPLAFKNLQSLSFVYTEPGAGLYLDPILKRALLAGMNPETRKNLRATIHSFSLQEYPGPGAAPMHILNTLYTTPGEELPPVLCSDAQPGGRIKPVPIEHEVIPEKIIAATRQTLRRLNNPTQTETPPLFKLWCEIAQPGVTEKEHARRKLANQLTRSLQELKKKDPRTARILEAVYLRRTTTLRQLAKELGIPERTIHRKIRKSIYELGKEVLEKMKGGN